MPDILACEHCGGAIKVIGSIEVPAVIEKTIAHLDRRAVAATPEVRSFAHTPSQQQLPDLTEPADGRHFSDAWSRGWSDTRFGVAHARRAKLSTFHCRKRFEQEAGALAQ